MVDLKPEIIEAEIIKVVQEINDKFQLKAEVNAEFCPGMIIASQILLTATDRIAELMNIEIPNSCYIFIKKGTLEQLSIKDAALKLIKEATPINGK